jgi:phage tail sheath gpL-like
MPNAITCVASKPRVAAMPRRAHLRSAAACAAIAIALALGPMRPAVAQTLTVQQLSGGK